MSAVERLALKLASEIQVPAHYRVVKGQIVKVDAYTRKGRAISDVFEAIAVMNERLGIGEVQPGASEAKGVMVGNSAFEVWGRDYKERHFSDVQQDAIRIYGGAEYETIGAFLRGDSGGREVLPTMPVTSGTATMEVHEVVQAMDSAIDEAPPLPEDITLWRGAKSSEPGDDVEMLYNDILDRGRDLVGAIIDDKSFLSTSIAREVGEGFSRGGSTRSPILFEIQAKKGQKGVYIGGSEVEWVLPRGTKFRITGVTEPDEEEGEPRAYVRVEIVGAEEGQEEAA